MLILFLALFHFVKSNNSRKIVRRNCKQNHTVGFFKRFLPLRKTSVRSKVQVFWEGHYISKQSNLSNSKFLWPSLKTWTLEINVLVLILIELGRQLTVSSIIFWKLDFKCFLVSIYKKIRKKKIQIMWPKFIDSCSKSNLSLFNNWKHIFFSFECVIRKLMKIISWKHRISEFKCDFAP